MKKIWALMLATVLLVGCNPAKKDDATDKGAKSGQSETQTNEGGAADEGGKSDGEGDATASLEEEMNSILAEIRQLTTTARQSGVAVDEDQLAALSQKMLEFGKRNSDSEIGRTALAQLIRNTGGEAAKTAIAELLSGPEIGEATLNLLRQYSMRNPSEDVLGWFETIAKKGESDKVKAAAIAGHLQFLELVERMVGYDTEGLPETYVGIVEFATAQGSDGISKRMIALANELNDNYGELSAGRSTFGAMAEDILFVQQNLRPGAVAPEIEGQDLDGVEFKLSDYRGKVVMLDFWGDW